ncbi:MAG: hypothetical protein U0168_09040 [Nannocystaceae bacterium]
MVEHAVLERVAGARERPELVDVGDAGQQRCLVTEGLSEVIEEVGVAGGRELGLHGVAETPLTFA